MASAASVLSLLSEKRPRSSAPANQLALVGIIRKGIASRGLSSAMAALDLTNEAAAAALDVPLRTLLRQKKQPRLDHRVSDKLIRLLRVVARAEEVLGSLHKAKHWMSTSNRALGTATPMSLLDTDVGTQAVEDVLGRIEYGIYS